MPYRRLPNTDQARLRALRAVIRKIDEMDYGNNVLTYKLINETKSFISIFEKQVLHYQHNFESQVSAGKKYQQIVANARLYISHFIQVLNLSVIRGDIKTEHKLFYHLKMDENIVPNLKTDASILHWGKNIIDGEEERIRNGGLPIYNPSIAKVKVHYEVFKEHKSSQKIYQTTTNRNLEELAALREKADRIILEIWNQVEEAYREEKPYSRLKKCQDFGIIYYYRSGERELTPSDDLVLDF